MGFRKGIVFLCFLRKYSLEIEVLQPFKMTSRTSTYTFFAQSNELNTFDRQRLMQDE
jgi:hypothetical protein